MTTDSQHLPITHELAVPAGDPAHHRDIVRTGARGDAPAQDPGQRPALCTEPDFAAAQPARSAGKAEPPTEWDGATP